MMKVRPGVNRRHFLKSAAVIPVLQLGCSPLPKTSPKRATPGVAARRVRPGDPAWPSAASWERLKQEVGGRLIQVQTPVAACQNAPNSAGCRELFRKLKNPYYIGDEQGLTQTSRWVDART